MYQRCFKIFGYEANIIGLKNFSLNEIAKAFLNETKTELSGIKIHKLEKENPELLKKYNIQDAVLLQKLDKKLSIIPLMIQECVWTGSFLNKFYIGELLDNYILREAKKAGMILQSRPSEEEHAINEEIDIVGGYVSEPQTGFYDNVHVCDFKSLYPSIIVGWNIGIDTLDNELSIKGEKAMIEFLNGRKIEVLTYIEWFDFLIKEKARLDPNNKYVQTANNAFFRKETRSFIGGLVQQLLDNRAEYKKKLKILQFDTPEYNNTYAAERVVKEMANSMFGITCDRRSRYFNKFVSEGITYTGQLLNKMSSHVAKSFGSTPIYGDTDSIFLTNAPDMIQHILDINVGLKDILDNTFGLFKNIVSLEFEKTFTKFILMKKKKYTGLLSMKDGKNIAKIFSRGTEDAKKTSIKLSKQTYLELVNIIFTNNSDQNVIEYIEKLRDHIYNDDIDLKDILLITRVSKPIASYKSLTLAGRLADRLIKEGKLLPIVESEKKVGTRLEYIVTKINDKNEGILLEEVNNNWNRDYYWEVQIFAPLKRVLDCTHPHIDWSKYDIQKIKKVRIKKNDTTKIDTIRRSR
jgi:DNA polymerase elongation subunit (family B)